MRIDALTCWDNELNPKSKILRFPKVFNNKFYGWNTQLKKKRIMKVTMNKIYSILYVIG
jgi:hypothetical protein